MRFGGRRPSPALVVAIFALAVAIAGSAIADPIATTSKFGPKKAKKIAKNIANKQINQRAGTLTVAKAKQLTRITVERSSRQVATNTTGQLAAGCPAGRQALGGGFGVPLGSIPLRAGPTVGGFANVILEDNQSFDSWILSVRNTNPSPITANVWVICAG